MQSSLSSNPAFRAAVCNCCYYQLSITHTHTHKHTHTQPHTHTPHNHQANIISTVSTVLPHSFQTFQYFLFLFKLVVLHWALRVNYNYKAVCSLCVMVCNE